MYYVVEFKHREAPLLVAATCSEQAQEEAIDALEAMGERHGEIVSIRRASGEMML